MYSSQAKNLWNGYFPAKILVCETNETMICNSPADIPQGKAIKVLQCNVKPNLKRINDLLQDISVLDPGMWENDCGPKNWFAVCDDSGIIAYFEKESDAYRFRLDYINRILNP